jgi:hypothetical protein
MTREEARELLKTQVIAPDDIYINNKRWKLEGTYLTRQEAIASAEFSTSSPSNHVFKYANGYANYDPAD